MRRFAAGLTTVLAVIVATAAAFLVQAHWEIRSISPPLPDVATLRRALDDPDTPVAIELLNTATQRGGPGPAPVGHPAIVLTWRDGRRFLIDAGMDREGAEAFSAPFELLFDSEPVEFHGSVATQLGDVVHDVGGVAFTHLHPDHTGGLPALCAALDRSLPVFQTSLQSHRGNYTTAPGAKHIEAAGCAVRRQLMDSPVTAVPGFPGLVAVAAGGHTPGSTVYFARVGDVVWGLAGDISNFQSFLLADRPKARIYSLLITPEATERLAELRRWLIGLDALPDFQILVAHDVEAIAARGVPAWRSAGS